MSEQARQLSDAALDLLFPPQCVVCGRPGNVLCRYCEQALPRLEAPLCAICSLPIQSGDQCSRCRRSRPVYKRLISAFEYHDGVQDAIHAMKYEKKLDLADRLVAAMCAVVSPPDEKVDALCGVPMSDERRRERGVNHADFVARALSHRWDLPVLPEGALSRVGSSARQADLDYRQRRVNVQDVFRADAGVVGGLTVMIVDDVCTTGATLDACAEALLAAGARRPLCATLARTLPRGLGRVAG